MPFLFILFFAFFAYLGIQDMQTIATLKAELKAQCDTYLKFHHPAKVEDGICYHYYEGEFIPISQYIEKRLEK